MIRRRQRWSSLMNAAEAEYYRALGHLVMIVGAVGVLVGVMIGLVVGVWIS